jgi:hypothetical protein
MLRLLYTGMPKVIAFGTNGRLYDSVPNHVWAAEGAEEIFDTGTLLVSGDEVTFSRGLTQGDDGTATALINADDLQRLIDQPGFPDTLAPPWAEPLPAWREPPGPKGGEQKVANLACEIAQRILESDQKPPRGRGRLAELSRLVQRELAKLHHDRKADSIRRSYIGPYLKDWEKRNPDK